MDDVVMSAMGFGVAILATGMGLFLAGIGYRLFRGDF